VYHFFLQPLQVLPLKSAALICHRSQVHGMIICMSLIVKFVRFLRKSVRSSDDESGWKRYIYNRFLQLLPIFINQFIDVWVL
jgi:hypothetical protein